MKEPSTKPNPKHRAPETDLVDGGNSKHSISLILHELISFVTPYD
jgi:hypothetical protein